MSFLSRHSLHREGGSYDELDQYYDMGEYDFLLYFCIHKDSFVKFHWFIQEYSNQVSITLVILYLIGGTGSNANYKKVLHAQISDVVVNILDDRCTGAILELLETRAVTWPNATITAKRIQEKYGYPSCIGFLGGTIFHSSSLSQLSLVKYFIITEKGDVLYIFLKFVLMN
jgi:hypothetical protein